MILDCKQSDIDKEFLVDFERKGLSIRVIREYLSDSGLSVIEKRGQSFIERRKHNQRMFEPFAHAHVVMVQPQADVTTSHAVVMDYAGKIFDPGSKQSFGADSYYYAVSTLGVFWD